MQINIEDGYTLEVTKIDETHFRSVLLGGFSDIGNIHHISEIINTGYYEQVKNFLEETK
jgi:hypothetical protein